MAVREIDALPGPRRLPLIGNAHQLRADRLHLIAEDWCDRYGPVYKFDIAGRKVLTIGDAEPINAMMRERPDGFRRWREIREIAGEMGWVGVFAAEGDDWRRMRRLAVTALNSNHLQRYFEIVSTCTERLHRRLSGAARDGGDFEIGEALSSFTVDVTSALAFGHDLNTLEDGDGGLQEHLHWVFHMTSRRLSAPFPYWRRFKLPADRRLDRSVGEIEKALTVFMNEARKRIAARPELREAPEDFLEGMIANQEGEGGFSDQEVAANVFTLLLAGEDTTSHTLAWTLWSLATRPEVQDRCAEEALAVLGDNVFPERYESMADLLFGEAVLREAMRLKSVAPLVFLEPVAEREVAGVRVPAGTHILLLTRYAGLRETDRATEFDPDRWLEEDGGRAPDQKAFLTFGAGPRFCPGRNLAFLEAKAALAMIARNFEIELAPGAEPVSERFGFSMSPLGLRVRLRERAPTPVAAH
jgi:cytochrome P450